MHYISEIMNRYLQTCFLHSQGRHFEALWSSSMKYSNPLSSIPFMLCMFVLVWLILVVCGRHIYATALSVKGVNDVLQLERPCAHVSESDNVHQAF